MTPPCFALRAASSGGSFLVGLSHFPSLVQAASGARLNSAAVAGVARQTAASAQIRQGADRSAEREGQSSPPAHRGARVIRTDALRFMLISQEPRGGQERKQDSEDDPDINAHLSSPAAALPTNSSLTNGIYFDDLVAQAPERKPVPSRPRHCRDVAHAQTGLA